MLSPANQRLEVFRLSKSTHSALHPPSPGTWGSSRSGAAGPTGGGIQLQVPSRPFLPLLLHPPLPDAGELMLGHDNCASTRPAVCHGPGFAMGHAETPRDGSHCPVSVLQVSSGEALLADSTAQCLWQRETDCYQEGWYY